MELSCHRAHDDRHLAARWRQVARQAGLRLRGLTGQGRARSYYLKSPALKPTGGLYVSAGIHGDEVGATEALILWAEQNVDRLAKLPVLLFPCLNPWGLRNNRRSDPEGVDLNRVFHRNELPLIAAIKQVVGSHQFACAVMLHEDYDAQGYYLYELEQAQPPWGEALISSAGTVIPIDQRAKIEGHKAIHGLIRRRFDLKRFEKLGYPEAIWLQMEHSARTFTVESPSEYSLDLRARAHIAVLEECLRRMGY